MQTFLPYRSFAESAKCLDCKRLGKQRIECKQILNSLLGHSDGWKNHPAVLMWKGHEYWLWLYSLYVCKEWAYRGYVENQIKHFRSLKLPGNARRQPQPPWLGWSVFHLSHRSNLLRKDFDYYKQYDWYVPNDYPYVWPVTTQGRLEIPKIPELPHESILRNPEQHRLAFIGRKKVGKTHKVGVVKV